jgi:hypothetical protein
MVISLMLFLKGTDMDYLSLFVSIDVWVFLGGIYHKSKMNGLGGVPFCRIYL